MDGLPTRGKPMSIKPNAMASTDSSKWRYRPEREDSGVVFGFVTSVRPGPLQAWPGKVSARLDA